MNTVVPGSTPAVNTTTPVHSTATETPTTRRAVELQSTHKYKEALRMFVELASGNRIDAHFMFKFAECLNCLRQHNEALKRVKQALALEPRNGEFHCLAGSIYGFIGNHDKANYHLGQAERYTPGMASTRWNQALAYLRQGNFEDGFRCYEAGYALGARAVRHEKPRWGGEWLGDDKTLYICAEQGYGDTVQFCRLLEQAKAASGARIVLEVQTYLLPILYDLRYADEVVQQEQHGAFGTDWDEWINLMSLPYVLGWKDERDIPPFEPYVIAPQPMNFSSQGDMPKVGLVWVGSDKHKNDVNRSLGWPKMRPVLDVAGVAFVSLQYGVKVPEGAPIGSVELRDFVDTVNVISGLDLVITVDTAVAHIAAAMGKPTWILLSYDCDWRWQDSGSKSAWYPSVTLFRQPSMGDWESVTNEVNKALETLRDIKSNYPNSTFTRAIKEPEGDYGIELKDSIKADLKILEAKEPGLHYDLVKEMYEVVNA